MPTPPPVDALLTAADNALRTLFSPHAATRQPDFPPPAHLKAEEARRAAALMRVNHAGEIAAQALYHGQALVARDPKVRELLHRSADEEGDHLAWCEQRLSELGSHTSRLAPLWYAGSFAIGATAALFGDAWSLGFVRETERQVESHFEGHLDRLPADDERSRAMVRQMQADEVRHGQSAGDAGARELPAPVADLMRMTARIMTGSAYWI